MDGCHISMLLALIYKIQAKMQKIKKKFLNKPKKKVGQLKEAMQ